MWHLRTKMGTFWLVPTETEAQSCYLGKDNEQLSRYATPQAAVEAVAKRETGCLSWDGQTRLNAPSDLSAWIAGEPRDWSV